MVLRTVRPPRAVLRGDRSGATNFHSLSPGRSPRSTLIITLPSPSQSFDDHLASLGLDGAGTVYRNQSIAQLYEHALARGEAVLGAHGQLLVETGKHTGRSPNDKFFVREPGSESHIDWSVNKATDAKTFDALLARVGRYLDGKDLFALDCYVGADPRYRLPVRIITEYAWHSAFARDLFIDTADRAPAGGGAATRDAFEPEFTVVNVPQFEADPARDNTASPTFILVNLARRMILIGGTRYAGETKKSVFTVMNYLMPLRNVLSMHCSANVGQEGDVAIFFGLSGTGKTTLSSDPHRPLIGDDEHGWSTDGVFNFEGGCYAKMIKLRQEAEPEIWAASHRFGAVLENVVFDPQTRELDLDDASKTENSRSAYPLDFLPNFVPSGMAGHPTNIVMLTADAFGVLPPIAKLSAEQAMYHFLSGYTAKVAGTERGVQGTVATFSTCFGAPFMVHHPTVYAKLLGERIAKHEVNCWLVNTGWTGGGYGVGSRMKIAYTRAMLNAAIEGRLANTTFEREPFFGLAVPAAVPDVPGDVLNPRNAWADKSAYDAQAKHLATLFADNFRRFEAHASPGVLAVAIKP
jgi:phosphoenolpyruvate carboxykinase (ATP)